MQVTPTAENTDDSTPAVRPRGLLDRPTAYFNVAFAVVLAAASYLVFDVSASSDWWIILPLLGLLLVGFLGLWIVRLAWCARHCRLGDDWRALVAWMVLPLLLAPLLALRLTIGGLHNLAFVLSEDAMTADAQARLADPELSVPGTDVSDGRIGWIQGIDGVYVLAASTSGASCASPAVVYEVTQGFVSGHGFVYSTEPPTCVEDAEHIRGHWYWARLWD